MSRLGKPPLFVLVFFYRRYPRSAARAVKSCARRHVTARGGGDSCPFPVHAGDITRVIADLLSLQPPSTGAAGAAAATGAGGSGADATGVGRSGGAETGEAGALRLAALPTWRLMDAPNAFQEAFSCAVLVIEAAQTAGARGQHRMRVREAFCSLHVCLCLFLPELLPACPSVRVR